MPDQAGHKKGGIHKLRHQFYHTLFVWSGVGSLWPSCAPHSWYTNRNEMRLRIRSKCQIRRGTKKGKARVIHNLRLFACLFDLGFRQFGCLACPHGGSHCNPRLPVIPGDPKCQIRRGTKKSSFRSHFDSYFGICQSLATSERYFCCNFWFLTQKTYFWDQNISKQN